MNVKSKMLVMALCAFGLSGCGNFLTRMSEIGSGPALSRIENPVEKADYRPVEMPMPDPMHRVVNANSLWRPGSRAFFKDLRASQVGDILTILVTTQDQAQLQNKTSRTRGDDSDKTSINSLAGFEGYLGKILPGGVDPTNLIDISSTSKMNGQGSVNRTEKINLTMAAVVMQVLPNGNLVVSGQQEIRVNHELRQILMTGIIRRADISSDNTIDSAKIAELRVAYGGRGTVSDVQQPKVGREIIDVINPF